LWFSSGTLKTKNKEEIKNLNIKVPTYIHTAEGLLGSGSGSLQFLERRRNRA
jgi:hypothetical protein